MRKPLCRKVYKALEEYEFCPLTRHILQDLCSLYLAEVKAALQGMKNRKAVGPDAVLVEEWKGETRVVCLTTLFSIGKHITVWRRRRILEKWRKSIVMPKVISKPVATTVVQS